MYGMFNTYRPKPPGLPIQPDVRLKRLPFYDVLAELLKPSSLVPQGNQRAQESCFVFCLSPQQASEVATNREVGPNTKNEYLVQVQLRFCRCEITSEQDDCFPSGVVLKVNNKSCTLPNPIPTNKPGVEPKRPPRPVNISSLVKLSPHVTNNISVGWTVEYGGLGYCVAIYLVRKLTAQDLLARLRNKGIRHADFTTGLIKEKLSEDADTEIATTSLRVSLLCPLGKMRMGVPCRSSTCTHLQCFDANLFLQMNEKKPTWTCPVCDKPAQYDHLVIDGYFQEVLNSSLLSSESHEIQLHKDGSWSSHVTIKEAPCNVSSPIRVNFAQHSNNKQEIIEEILDEDEPPPIAVVKDPVKDREEEKANVLIIDLTCSDSEEEEVGRALNRPVDQRQVKPDHTLSDISSDSDDQSPAVIMLDSPSPPPSNSPVHLVAPAARPTSVPSSISPVLPSPVATPPAIPALHAQIPPLPSRSPAPQQPTQQYPMIIPSPTPNRPFVMSIRMPPESSRYQPY